MVGRVDDAVAISVLPDSVEISAESFSVGGAALNVAVVPVSISPLPRLFPSPSLFCISFGSMKLKHSPTSSFAVVEIIYPHLKMSSRVGRVKSLCAEAF